MVGDKTRTFVSGEIRDAITAESWRWRALDVAVKVAMPILLGVSAWTATTILDHESRLKVIETRTVEDKRAREEWKARQRDIADALAELKIIAARNEESTKAILRRLDKIEARADARDERERERDRRAREPR